MTKDNSIHGKIKQAQSLITKLSSKLPCGVDIPKVNTNGDFVAQLKQLEKLTNWLKVKVNECCNGDNNPFPGYTLFLGGSTIQSECLALPEQETAEYYHDGSGAYPVIGDTVFVDDPKLGFTALFTGINSVRYVSGVAGQQMKTDGNGIMISFVCK